MQYYKKKGKVRMYQLRQKTAAKERRGQVIGQGGRKLYSNVGGDTGLIRPKPGIRQR